MNAPIKPRRVDFCAGDWLGGTIDLTLAERGVYVTACALIYMHCGPIRRTDLRRACPDEGPIFRRALNRLVALGKLTVGEDGKFDQRRCEIELEKAHKRIENGRLGGRPPGKTDEKRTQNRQKIDKKSTKNLGQKDENSNEINDGEKPPFFPTRAQKLPGEAKLPEDSKILEGDRGRCAPSAESAPAPRSEPVDPEHVAYVDAAVERAVAALRGGVPKGIHDDVAYQAAIKDAKFTNLVKAVNEWVGTGLDGDARFSAWEVLAAAEKAERRAAMTPASRKALDKIVEMYRASSAEMETAA